MLRDMRPFISLFSIQIEGNWMMREILSNKRIRCLEAARFRCKG